MSAIVPKLAGVEPYDENEVETGQGLIDMAQEDLQNIIDA